MPGAAARGLTRDLLVREAREMRPFILPDIVEVQVQAEIERISRGGRMR
jgi:hypothetical protein